ELSGGDGNDILEGAFGADVLSGGSGSDQFVFAFGDGGFTAATADLVTDYDVIDDEIGLAFGLTFADLNITDGAGGAEVAIGFTGEVLATFQGISAVDLDAGEFVLI
ncbi:MAG: calcium-binding protein, partial [Pseudomonadota bacterium]